MTEETNTEDGKWNLTQEQKDIVNTWCKIARIASAGVAILYVAYKVISSAANVAVPKTAPTPEEQDAEMLRDFVKAATSCLKKRS